MEIVIYQNKKKKANGRLYIYIALWRSGRKVLIDTGLESVYELIKTKGVGIGASYSKEEPNWRAKQKRLESIYWMADEIVTSNPRLLPLDLKDKILNKLGRGKSSKTKLTSLLIAHKKKVKESTGKMFEHTAGLVEKFDKNASLDITTSWLERFETWLSDRGISTNGISIHMRNIRTIFNDARKNEITDNYPFLRFKIKSQRKSINAMGMEQLRELQKIDNIYTDIFMLMFYLAGINIGDLLLCRKLTNGRMVYTRRKTGKTISIPVYPEAMEIIEKHKGKDYLLNVMDTNKDEKSFNQRMNKRLKALNIFDGLSTYTARYTFATMAAECGVSRDIIAACLGHSWSDVTSHYIAYSQKQIDEAIRKVIDYVNKDDS